MSSCRPMSMTVYNIGLSLTWLLLANGCIPKHLHKSLIHAPSLNSLTITALSRVMWVWLATPSMRVALRSSNRENFFAKIFENFSPYGYLLSKTKQLSWPWLEREPRIHWMADRSSEVRRHRSQEMVVL